MLASKQIGIYNDSENVCWDFLLVETYYFLKAYYYCVFKDYINLNIILELSICITTKVKKLNVIVIYI